MEPVDARICDDEEFQLLRRGLIEWSGPIHPSDVLARALGFPDKRFLIEESARIRRDLDAGKAISALDWERALVLTEIAFASEVLGNGRFWTTTTGLQDEVTIRTLRRLQRKLAHVIEYKAQTLY